MRQQKSGIFKSQSKSALRDKKGSLNLSIQAIVVLVMAMAILGLGLGFIRTLMGQGQDQFTTAIDNAQLENPATADNPVTVDRTVDVKSGKSARFKLGFYNIDTLGSGNFGPALSGCDNFTIKSGNQTVGIGSATGYEVLISTTASVGTEDVCTINIMEGANNVASRQFFVRVTA